jgi:hypothetical protein
MSCLHGRQLLYLYGMENRSPTRVGGGARALGLCRLSWAHAPVGARLVVRGGDFSCEAETCRRDPSSGELVGDAANWTRTGCLASVGLDQGP